MAAEVDQTLMHWLSRLPEDMLATIISNRPEAARPPWPRHLLALSELLGQSAGTTAAIRRLPAPAVQVLRALAVLPHGVTRPDLAGLLGVDAADSSLTDVLASLGAHGLAWESPDSRLLQGRNVAAGWLHPLGLGSSAADIFPSLTVDQVKGVARRHGPQLNGGKHAIVARFQDRDRLAATIAAAPESVRELLATFAEDGPILPADGISFYYPPRAQTTPTRWAVERGLLCPREWEYAEMPREVALAVRGPDYHAPFTPAPPERTTAEVSAAVVDEEAAAAAGHLLDRVEALLDLAAKEPVATLKTGGVGQREVKRVAKALSCSAEEIRVVLEIVSAAGLLVDTSSACVTAGGDDDWQRVASAERLRDLVDAWWSTERSPLRSTGGSRPAVLTYPDDGEVVLAVRRAAVEVLAALPAARGATDVTDRVAWLCPLYPRSLIEECLQPALEEATLLGLVARGAVSELGRALSSGGDLVAAAKDALAMTRQSALFGPDLTAIVTGPPAADLARRLDRVADRESRAQASVWRFSPASVRRAFDEGFTEAETLSALADLAQGGLPQPLVYLVRDVARRHGEVSVAEVVCVIRAEDAGLIAEIAAHRRLAKLRLRPLAPTVLASAAAAEPTLAALRDAGYAPVPVGPDGARIVARAMPRPVERTHSRSEPPPMISPRDLAARLLDSTITAAPIRADQVYAVIARHARQLPTTDQFAFQYLVQYGHRTRIEVSLGDGTTAGWNLEKGELHDDVLDAWCPDIGDYQRVSLSSITQSRPLTRRTDRRAVAGPMPPDTVRGAERAARQSGSRSAHARRTAGGRRSDARCRSDRASVG